MRQAFATSAGFSGSSSVWVKDSAGSEKRKDIVPRKITPKTERTVQQVALPAENIGFMMDRVWGVWKGIGGRERVCWWGRSGEREREC